MTQLETTGRTIEAEIPFAAGHVRLVRNVWSEPIDVLGVGPEHHLELALLPRSRHARGCFPQRWGPDRFERFGELFLLPADEAVHAKSECRHQYSIVCHFLPEALNSWLNEEVQWTEGRLQGSLNIASPAIRGLLLHLGAEVRDPGIASASMIDLMAGQIAIELARFCIGIQERNVKGGLAAGRLRLIDERLAERCAAPTLTELAALCGLSVRHLTRAFRISRGRSIGAYIAECRMQQAKRLLTAGECVKSIAYSMGFNSASNFCSAFRRSTGETPGQYRQRAGRSSIAH
jgi:AraC family transcriptional regulator